MISPICASKKKPLDLMKIDHRVMVIRDWGEQGEGRYGESGPMGTKVTVRNKKF